MKVLKSKKLWLSISIVIGLIVSFFIGATGAKVSIGKEKVTYDALKKKIEEKERELTYAKSKVKEDMDVEQRKLENKKTEVAETLKLVENKNQLTSEVDKLSKDVEGKKSEIGKLDTDINSKKGELEKLTEGVKAKKEEPRTIGAGEWTVGADIPAGRYKATATGRGSNFVVYNSSGRPIVNTILGNSSIGVGDYVFSCSSGDKIKTQEAVKLIPVE